MDRRRFAKLIAAAVVGVRVADELTPAQPLLLLEDARTNEWDRSPELDNATWTPTDAIVQGSNDGRRWHDVPSDIWIDGDRVVVTPPKSWAFIRFVVRHA